MEPKKTERVSVWIDKDMAKQAKIIAAHKGCPLSEVIEDALRKPLDTQSRKLAAHEPAKA